MLSCFAIAPLPSGALMMLIVFWIFLLIQLESAWGEEVQRNAHNDAASPISRTLLDAESEDLSTIVDEVEMIQ